MVNEVSVLLKRGIQIRRLDGRLDTNAMPEEISMLIVSILGYVISQELQQIKSRTAEGRSVALSRGVKFGAKRKYTKEQASLVCEMRSQGKGWGTIAKSINFTVVKCRCIVNLEVEV